MKDHTIVLEHPKLGGYHATVEAHFYSPVCEAHRLWSMGSRVPATTTLSDPSLEVAGAWTDPAELCGLCGFESEMVGYDPHYGLSGSPKFPYVRRS